MEFKTAEEQYREYLDTLPLGTLRVVGRNNGVPQSSSRRKEDLMRAIIAVFLGEVAPVPRSNKGAPVKQEYLDPAITRKLAELRTSLRPINRLEVSMSGEPGLPYLDPVYSGILEITPNGYGFVRAKNCQPSAVGDVFIPAQKIQKLGLKKGDMVACTALPEQKSDSPAIADLLSVNGRPVGEYENRRDFDSFSARYPEERIALGADGELSLRLIDLFTPIGKGQRGLIVAPPKAGKTTLLKQIARTAAARSELTVLVLLIDERPEEVTDFKSDLRGAEVFSSTFDEGAEHHIRGAELVFSYAKRLAESGRDVVLLLDSLTKLTRAYNYVAPSSGKILSGGLDSAALTEPKRFFGAARNLEGKGSLTVLATVLVDTGSRLDEVIYEEFKGTGNSDIVLSRELAERRVFPAIDLRRSGTRKEELLLSEKELEVTRLLRTRGVADHTEGVIEMMKKTADNAEFVARAPEWVKIYKRNG